MAYDHDRPSGDLQPGDAVAYGPELVRELRSPRTDHICIEDYATYDDYHQARCAFADTAPFDVAAFIDYFHNHAWDKYDNPQRDDYKSRELR